MISDARELTANTKLTADICIVGAGPAGITLALALSGAGFSVCLLEGGDFDITDENQALYQGQMSGIDSWTLDGMRARVFGGTSAWWGGWCRPLVPEDFVARSYIPESGWPLSYDDLVPYYKRAQDTLELGLFEYDAAALSARLGMPLLPTDPGILETRVYQFSPPTRFGTRYRADIEQATDIHTYVNANLQKIHLTQRGGSVSHLTCATLTGGRFSVEAQKYILALGGIENARMLLASNDEQSEGIANGSGRVGWFMEHPHYYLSGMILWRETPDLRFYASNQVETKDDQGQLRTATIGSGIGLSAAIRESEQLPNFTATMDIGSFDMDTDTDTIGPTRARSIFGRNTVNPSVFQLTYRSEQTPTSDSRLILSSDLDALGTPRVDLHWAVSPSDNEARKRALAIMANELGRAGLGRFWDLQLTENPEWFPNPGGHHLGTTRMSADPSRGVVDANLRTHEVPNLYTLGSSVFPTGGDSNPTLTIVALAHRLADYLKNNR